MAVPTYGSAQQVALGWMPDLVARCAPEIAAKELVAVAQTESGFDPLAIHDNTSKKSYSPTNKSEALAIAQGLLDEGHSIDVGLMQINSANFGWLRLNLDEALEPCPSVRAGAAVLTAVSRYNTGSPTRGFKNGYVSRVLAARHNPSRITSSSAVPKTHPTITPTAVAEIPVDVKRPDPFSTESQDGSSFLITNLGENK